MTPNLLEEAEKELLKLVLSKPNGPYDFRDILREFAYQIVVESIRDRREYNLNDKEGVWDREGFEACMSVIETRAKILLGLTDDET